MLRLPVPNYSGLPLHPDRIAAHGCTSQEMDCINGLNRVDDMDDASWYRVESWNGGMNCFAFGIRKRFGPVPRRFGPGNRVIAVLTLSLMLALRRVLPHCHTHRVHRQRQRRRRLLRALFPALMSCRCPQLVLFAGE